MMAMVEGMPLPALEQGLPWDWETFGEFLDSLDGKTAVNRRILGGPSALRRYVMGTDADQPASSDQLDQMVQALHEGLAAGGMGFSTSLAHTHWDGDNEPVPAGSPPPRRCLPWPEQYPTILAPGLSSSLPDASASSATRKSS